MFKWTLKNIGGVVILQLKINFELFSKRFIFVPTVKFLTETFVYINDNLSPKSLGTKSLWELKVFGNLKCRELQMVTKTT